MTTTEDDLWMDQEIEETRMLTSLVRSITASLDTVEQSMVSQAAKLELTAEILATWAQLFEMSPLRDRPKLEQAPRETKPEQNIVPELRSFKLESSKPFGTMTSAHRENPRIDPALASYKRPTSSLEAPSHSRSGSQRRRQTLNSIMPRQLGW